MIGRSPRIVFVLGKGGVGRSTVSAALALAAAARGERALVFEWTIADPIAPWFGRPSAGTDPVEVTPGVSVVTYTLEDALRAYFVDHLHIPRFHRQVVRSASVRGFVDAAPGLAELLFLGTLWWLTTLAPEERGFAFDRIIVDAPATGHGASILDMANVLASLPAGGLLGRELGRVVGMMRDPTWTGAAIVATPDELTVQETTELLPRATEALGRRPLAAFVNRAVGDRIGGPAGVARLAAHLSPSCGDALGVLYEELRARAAEEARLADLFAGRTERGVVMLPDLLLERATPSPRAVVEALAARIGGTS